MSPFSSLLHRLLPLALAALLLAACGNKGDLVKPTPAPGTQPPPTAPTTPTPEAGQH